MALSTRPVVLVTAAGKRLGRVVACDFAKRGWSVAVHVRKHDRETDTTLREIEKLGGRAQLFEADLASDTDVAHLVPHVCAILGPPQCLVNNASLFVYDDIDTLTPAQWDQHFAINLKAPVFLTKALAASLPPGVPGVVVNILDQRVWKPTPHFLSYAASKSALLAMTQMLAQALAPRVRVNAIGPGPMLQSLHQSEADFRAQYEATPLGRVTQPEEIAAAIRFILDAPSLTGQMIALDAGQHLAWRTPDIGDGHG